MSGSGARKRRGERRTSAGISTRPRYNKDGWVLCRCTNCGRANYVEPHGTTAKCVCSVQWTEHENLPPEAR